MNERDPNYVPDFIKEEGPLAPPMPRRQAKVQFCLACNKYRASALMRCTCGVRFEDIHERIGRVFAD